MAMLQMRHHRHSNRALRLLGPIALATLVYVVSDGFGLFAQLVQLARRLPLWRMEELLVTLTAVGVAISAMAARRWWEHRRETAKLMRSERRVRASERRFATAFSATPQPTLLCDVPTGKVLDANRAFERLTGRARIELVGRTSLELGVWRDREQFATVRDLLEAYGRVSELDTAVRRPDGTARLTRFSAVVMELDGGPAVLCSLTDVTDQRRLEAQLAHLAYHDPLTGLANRARFHDRVARSLGRRGRGRTVAAMLLDLDDFKRVNDALGHAAGDDLLRGVAARLTASARRDDTVARLGGDEFAILLEADDATEPAGLAERIMTALRDPIRVDGRDLRVGGSLGFAVASADDTPETLLRNADVAMYAAKARGKGSVVPFERSMHADLLARMELESELRQALERGELRLEYQPIVEVHSGAVRTVEALLRWDHPRRGVVSPAEFIDVAEESGLIVPLGRWTLAEACRQAAEWRRDGFDVGMSVNLSGRQLLEASIVDDVATALATHALPASALTLEITERVIVQQTDAVRARMRGLKALGVRLALDDFGTGHASISYLREFPLDVLKIDREFIASVADDSREASLARVMVALGDSLTLETVAEGVEEPRQRAALESLGCHLAQGYLFARPMRPADAARLFAGARAPVARAA